MISSEIALEARVDRAVEATGIRQTGVPSTGLELRSIMTGAGELELSLVKTPMPTP